MPRIVTEGRGGLPHVGYHVDSIIRIIGIAGRALFRRRARFQTPVSIVRRHECARVSVGHAFEVSAWASADPELI